MNAAAMRTKRFDELLALAAGMLDTIQHDDLRDRCIDERRIMSKDEAAIEAEIQAKGLTAPRLTPGDIEAVIDTEQYWLVPGTTATVCALILKNGFVVVGESAAASSENFDHVLGRKIARQKAREKIWALEGYLLRQRLADGNG